MKRIFSILLIIGFCFLVIGCTNKEKTKQPTVKEETKETEGKEETKTTPELTVDETNIVLDVGYSKEIKYEVKNCSEELVEIKSENEEIVRVDGKLIHSLKPGETKVIVSIKGYDIKKEINVKVNGLEELVISLTKDIMYVGETQSILFSIPVDSCKISDESIASIENGVITALKAGKVEIKATANGITKKCSLTIYGNEIIVNGNFSCNVDGEVELSASLDGYNGDFTFEVLSGDEYISIDGAKVTGLSEGVALIKVSAVGLEKTIEFAVLGEPELRVEGPTSVYIGYQIQLTAVLINLTGEVTWKSNFPKAATVDANGLVTCVGAGNVVITCSCGEDYSVRYKIECTKEPDRVDLDFDGGVSEELYFASTKKLELTIHAYASVGGYYWSDYPTHVFIYDRTNDIMPTFSDRIYFGKNPDSGFYEVKGIQTSGGSVWPDEAEYVITYSSSYEKYRTYHNKTVNLEKGDIVFLSGSPDDITNSINIDAYIFAKTPDAKTVSFDKSEFKKLPTPTKLGYDFKGWLNTKTNEVINELNDVTGIIPLKAQWEELNPVTGIDLLNYKNELLVGETLTVTGKVIPEDAYFQKVFYSSSNENIIEIDKDGLITAKNAGECYIIVTDYVGRIKIEYPITIYSNPQIVLSFDDDSFDGNMNVDENVTIKTQYFGKDYGKFNVSYESSNNDVLSVDETGRITALQKGIASITVKGKCEKLDTEFVLSYQINVDQLNTETKLDELLALIAENNFSVVAMGNACLYNDGTNRYYKPTYGSLNNYLFDDLIIDRTQENVARNNPNNHKDRTDWHGGVEFVTVHDTATLTSTAQSTAAGMASGETSIHYTTGNGVVCSCVPEEFIAYHAGDGTGTQFRWYSSGVKVNDDFDVYDFNTYPEFDLVKDGTKYFFTINGEKTTIQAPTSNGSQTISNPSKENLPDLGPVWKIVDGEFYLGTTWVDFSQMAAGCIGSHGGNNNSIGIEMGVGTGSNMYDTWLRTSKLVADILIRNNLDLSRVKQHNTWTGKNCPQCIRAGGNWWDFMEMVRIEYIIMKEYAGYEIKFSCDSNIVDKYGVVVRAPKVTEVVNYTVTVSKDGQEKSITLSSVIPGTDTWERWNGTYKSALIWNGGYFNLNKKND